MRGARRHLLLAGLGAGLWTAAASPAAGAPGPPADVRPTADFVRTVPCVAARLRFCIADPPLPVGWSAPTFTGGSTARRYLVDPIVDIDGADPAAVVVDDPAATGATLPVRNGHLYHLRVYASESVGGTTATSPPVERAFRVDQTPPTASVTIAGGAAYTRSREVSVAVAASDPLTAGAFPASGVGGLAVWSGPAPPPAQIAGPVLGALTVTLPDGPDGPRTVNAVAFDRARHPLSQPGFVLPIDLGLFPLTPVAVLPVVISGPITLPPREFTPVLPRPPLTGPVIAFGADAPAPAQAQALVPLTPRLVGISDLLPATAAPPPPAVGAPGNGNASATAVDEVILDTTPPAVAVAVTPPSTPAGVPVTLDAATSADATAGVDPAGVAWTLGDGATATGARVQHEFAAAGTYRGSVAVPDRAGNVGVAEFTVRVSAPVTTDGAAADPGGGSRTTGVSPSLKVRASVGEGLAGTRARLAASWRESRLTGRIALGGRALRALRLRAVLRPRGPRAGRARTIAASLRLRPGPVSRSLLLPPGVLPGAYDLEVAATTGPPLRRVLSLRIPPPGEGVASVADAGLSPGGRALTSAPRGTRALFARFRLAALPAPGRRVTITWYHPDGRAVGTAAKARRPRVVSFVRSPAALPPGRWRAVLRAGTVQVARVTVRVR